MAINCQKCLYHMTHGEAIGYMTADVAAVFKNVILPCLIQAYAKRSVQDFMYDKSEEMIVGILNSAAQHNVDKEKGV